MTAVDRVVAALGRSNRPKRAWLVGEPFFSPPERLRAAFSRAAGSARVPYGPAGGLPELRAALAELHRRQGQPVEPSQVVVTHGAKAALLALFGALLADDDEVVCPLPCYPAYPRAAAAVGARVVRVPAAGGGARWDLDGVLAALSPRSRLLVLSSPCNPTGGVLREVEAQKLVEACREHGVRLVCDEAYESFRMRPHAPRPPVAWDPGRETVVQVRSLSKTYALCGWRIGWVAASAEVARAVEGWQGALLNPPNTPAQEAAIAVTAVDEAELTAARDVVRARLIEVRAAFEGSGLVVEPPEGGFYLWCDLRPVLGELSSLGWCERTAERWGLGLWPGEDFGAPGWVRVSAVAPPEGEWDRWCDHLRGCLLEAVARG